MAKQSRSAPVMQTVLDAVAERLMSADESLIRIPEICEATGVNYGSVYHHFGSREGVIDAAYDMMFTALAEEGVTALRQVNDSVGSFEEYVVALQGMVGAFASGPERRARRGLRVRVVAASMMRPELKARIGLAQARLTEELMRIVEFGQERDWLRKDMSARSIAVFVQVMLVGRTLDDISAEPIVDGEWAAAMAVLLSELLNYP
jgi:AcrR family transcriptional regulator